MRHICTELLSGLALTLICYVLIGIAILYTYVRGLHISAQDISLCDKSVPITMNILAYLKI